MKRKFILAIVALAAGVCSATAQDGEKLMLNAGNIEHVTILNDLDVVLVPGNGETGSVSLDPAFFEVVDVKITKNKLSIASVKSSAKNKPTVYLQVNNLRTISVENNSQVKTVGVINSPRLELYVGGNARAHLRSNGTINAHALNDAELKVNYLSERAIVKR